MKPGERRARVRALAKINLDLRVLNRRPDGFHELRTVFQTVSLADTLEITYRPGEQRRVTVHSRPHIPDNLVERAALLVLEASGAHGEVEISLRKRIPMGAGLGGGSSDAAAVLLAVPVLAGARLDMEALIGLAGRLGSDVPFFLLGGRAVGLGRGCELYPLPEPPATWAVVVAPELHISTAEAYAALERALTAEPPPNMINSFQSWIWTQLGVPLEGSAAGRNDFEPVVLRQYPVLERLKRELVAAGAKSVSLTGSGAAVYGLFRTPAEAELAGRRLGDGAVVVSLVSRARYRSLWHRWLRFHVQGRQWPPGSRYAP